MPSVQRRKPDDADSITTMRIRQPDTSSTTPQVGMSQRRKPDDADSTIVMRIRPHQRGFDNHDTSSTTPQVGMSQRRKPDDADSTTTIWIRQQRYEFDNDRDPMTMMWIEGCGLVRFYSTEKNVG